MAEVTTTTSPLSLPQLFLVLYLSSVFRDTVLLPGVLCNDCVARVCERSFDSTRPSFERLFKYLCLFISLNYSLFFFNI
jgi:hypothetical protein